MPVGITHAFIMPAVAAGITSTFGGEIKVFQTQLMIKPEGPIGPY